MKSQRFWIPVGIFLGLTPFKLFLGLFSSGSGHGDYFLAQILFPYTLWSTAAFHSLRQSFLLLAIVQYPVYGLLTGIANLYRKLLIYGLGLAVVHTVTVVASFAFADRYFS